jgi:hypothetical protein
MKLYEGTSYCRSVAHMKTRGAMEKDSYASVGLDGFLVSWVAVLRAS